MDKKEQEQRLSTLRGIEEDRKYLHALEKALLPSESWIHQPKPQCHCSKCEFKLWY